VATIKEEEDLLNRIQIMVYQCLLLEVKVERLLLSILPSTLPIQILNPLLESLQALQEALLHLHLPFLKAFNIRTELEKLSHMDQRSLLVVKASVFIHILLPSMLL
jgi:hypothetical protein